MLSIFKSWSLRKLLLTGFFVVTGGLFCVGISGYLTLYHIIKDFNLVANQNLPKTRVISEMFLAAKDLRIYVSQIGFYSIQGDHTKIKSTLELIEQARIGYESLKVEYGSFQTSGEEDAIFKAQEEKWKDFVDQSVKTASLSNNSKDIKLLLKEMAILHEINEDFIKSLIQLKDLQNEDSKRHIDEANSIMSYGHKAVTLSILFGTTIGVFLSLVFSKSITARILLVTQKLFAEATEMTKGSDEMSRAGFNLAEATNQQASALQETVASLNQIQAMVQFNTDKAMRSADLAKESQIRAHEGQKSLEVMVEEFGVIMSGQEQMLETIQNGSSKLHKLSDVVAEISQKTKVINGIALETKLLSFNAYVEAARVGDHGRGFAVIADQVGKLAQMSNQAAHDIASILEKSISKIRGSVEETQDTLTKLACANRERVNRSAHTLKEFSSFLEALVASSEAAKLATHDICIASEQQGRGVSEITSAMAQLDQSTQENVKVSNDSSALSEKLRGHSIHITQVIQELQEIVYGKERIAAQTIVHGSEVREVNKPTLVEKTEQKNEGSTDSQKNVA